MAILDLLGRRWTLRILWEMREGNALSFREIQSTCDDLSPTTLNIRLKELRETLIIELIDKESYRLTPTGHHLLETLNTLNDWAENWAFTLNSSLCKPLPHDLIEQINHNIAHAITVFCRTRMHGNIANA
jgi:DNA-binding HxlR family transcriptional regulator